MRKRAISNILAGIGVSLTLLFTACVDDTNLMPPPTPDNSFTEEFDTVQSAWDRGWRFMNRSTPFGRLWVESPTFPVYPFTNIGKFSPDWQQAEQGVNDDGGGVTTPVDHRWFRAFSTKSTSTGYLANSWAANGNFPIPSGSSDEYATWWINNWVVSPEVTMKNGDKIVFYTRCDTTARLQVRINKTNTDFTNVGYSLEDPGDFSSLILDINPTYVAKGLYAFPYGNWTRFEATVYGLDKPTRGRFALRSMLPGTKGNIWGAPNAAPTSALEDILHRLNISVLGIDKVQYISK